jgi:hypothetical protein
MEEVHVPGIGGEAAVDGGVDQLVGGRDLGAAALAQVVERVLVHLLREGLVHDVDVLEVLVLAAQPGVDPERGHAHDLLLLVAHAAGDVHAQDDDGVALRHLAHVPGAVAAVLADGHDERVARVVEASATWRLSASRNVRLKWRRLSGPTRRMFEYLTFSTGTERRPRGRIRGSSSSSPRIAASSSS